MEGGIFVWMLRRETTGYDERKDICFGNICGKVKK